MCRSATASCGSDLSPCFQARDRTSVTNVTAPSALLDPAGAPEFSSPSSSRPQTPGPCPRPSVRGSNEQRRFTPGERIEFLRACSPFTQPSIFSSAAACPSSGQLCARGHPRHTLRSNSSHSGCSREWAHRHDRWRRQLRYGTAVRVLEHQYQHIRREGRPAAELQRAWRPG